MEYPSRSNLNCFLSFNEASAKGDELFGPTVIVDITLVRETIIFCYPWWIRTTINWTKTSCPAVRRKGNLILQYVKERCSCSLIYGPFGEKFRIILDFFLWAIQGSNLWPWHYECPALTDWAKGPCTEIYGLAESRRIELHPVLPRHRA